MEKNYVKRGVAVFDRALECVSAAGFVQEIEWARKLDIDSITETQFLHELAWCILNAGMRERVIRSVFPRVASCFWKFRSVDDICATRSTCVTLARRYFDHVPKLTAIASACDRIRTMGGFATFHRRLRAAPLEECEAFDYIGPTTKWHLARNLGAECAKPDRHLVRIAHETGCRDVQRLCHAIAVQRGERIGVVDLVLWRHAALGCSCTANMRDGWDGLSSMRHEGIRLSRGARADETRATTARS